MHIGKTGGTSINAFFGRHFDSPSSVKKGHPYWGKHWRPSKIEETWPDEWKEFYKFSFVRNPWDRLVSIFFFRRNYRKVITASMQFEEFARKIIEDRRKGIECGPDQQITWFQNRLDEFDFIGRFENLQEDFEYVCHQIGAEPKTLIHALETDHEHYTTYYDEELRDLVGESFKEDCDIFGYEFLNK